MASESDDDEFLENGLGDNDTVLNGNPGKCCVLLNILINRYK